MKKARTYALFQHNRYFKFYLRGAYYNLQMNRILCPDWDTVIFVDEKVLNIYSDYFAQLKDIGRFECHQFNHIYLCTSMLMRLLPIKEYNVIACRDIDAITTLRDVDCGNEFMESNAIAHGINDNPSHGIPLMGGMSAFKKEALEGINIDGLNLPSHGQDQQFLMENIYPKVKDKFLFHNNPPYNFNNPLWESDLTCRHIGSSGINEMETLRFFERQGIDHFKFTEKFKSIFG